MNCKKLWRVAWIVACISLIIALCTFPFLPKYIPIHFNGGTIDGYTNKIWIFNFPLLEILLILISRIELFKYICMNISKTGRKTEAQYNVIMFCVIVLIAIAEVVIISLSLSNLK